VNAPWVAHQGSWAPWWAAAYLLKCLKPTYFHYFWCISQRVLLEAKSHVERMSHALVAEETWLRTRGPGEHGYGLMATETKARAHSYAHDSWLRKTWLRKTWLRVRSRGYGNKATEACPRALLVRLCARATVARLSRDD